MLNEGLPPLTAHEGGVEKVILRREMGGDERKDIQRDTVDRDERVPPLADICQRRRNILTKLRDVAKGEAVVGISAQCGKTLPSQNDCLQRTMENTRYASTPRSEQIRVAKATGPFLDNPV